ncbi:MAG: hypothetical protein M1819_004110 [Sarea resinae]|nr:MAG: hypothetical protein M1819_004110 [Sarea resinae]
MPSLPEDRSRNVVILDEENSSPSNARPSLGEKRNSISSSTRTMSRIGSEKDSPIDVDSEEDIGWDEDDFMSDGEFERTFQAVVRNKRHRAESPSSLPLRNGPLSEAFRTLEKFNSNGSRFQKGKTVELDDGDFLRITKVIQDRSTTEVFLRGHRFRGEISSDPAKDFLDLKENELVKIVELDLDDNRPEEEQSVEELPLSRVRRIRLLFLTNRPYPSCSSEENGEAYSPGSPPPRLFCRWKYVRAFKTAKDREKNRPYDRSIRFLTSPEADKNFDVDDETLQEAWRGATVKGGECKGMTTEESSFNRREKNDVRNLCQVTPSSTPKKRRYAKIPGESRGSPIVVDLTGNASRKGKEVIRNLQTDTPIPCLLPTSKEIAETLLSSEASGSDISFEETSRLAFSRYTFGDSFCGAGGMSRGAKQAGYKIKWGFDHDQAAIHSYSLNFFGTECNSVDAHHFVALDDDIKVDVLHLSPPCQIFSPAHTVDGKDDERNGASFFAVPELIKKAKPRITTFENTSGLEQRHELWFRALIDCFTSLNFSVRWKIVNCAEYGLAQARKRLIVIASCPGEALPTFPPATHTIDPELQSGDLVRLKTVNDAISNIPAGFPNHAPERATQRNARSYDGDQPLRHCITTSGGGNIHPSGTRDLTHREFACLQGFPLEHKFGSVCVKKQIGNAVPPCVSKVLLEHIKKALKKADGIAVESTR